jgi:hypothetical protein
MFNQDYEKIAVGCLRPDHRNSNQSVIMKAQSAGMVAMDLRFARFRESVDYILQHDSRKLHIEKVLNDQFDNVSRRITIDNVVPRGKVYLYEPGDDKPVYIYEAVDTKPVHLYETAGIDVSNVNFVVNLPIAIQPTVASELRKLEIKINAQVNRYKVDSKNHTLLWIN